jgi:hypothetical protein
LVWFQTENISATQIFVLMSKKSYVRTNYYGVTFHDGNGRLFRNVGNFYLFDKMRYAKDCNTDPCEFTKSVTSRVFIVYFPLISIKVEVKGKVVPVLN